MYSAYRPNQVYNQPCVVLYTVHSFTQRTKNLTTITRASVAHKNNQINTTTQCILFYFRVHLATLCPHAQKETSLFPPQFRTLSFAHHLGTCEIMDQATALWAVWRELALVVVFFTFISLTNGQKTHGFGVTCSRRCSRITVRQANLNNFELRNSSI